MNFKNIYYLLLIFLFSFSCSSGYDSDSELTKLVTERYSNGKPKVVQYLKNQKDTASSVKRISYYNNGQVEMEGAVNNGNRDKEWKSYRSGGQIWSIMNYKNGYREGITENWRDNGNRNYIGYYRKDKKHGVWQFFDYYTGKLNKEVYFEKDKKIKEEDF